MHVLRAAFSGSLAVFAAVAACAQQDFSKVEIKATAVSGGIHMLEGSGGNIGVSVGTDGVLIVDSQFAPLAPRIEAVLKRLSSGSLHYLVNTHWHGDHTGGNEFFGKQAPIVAHANVRKRLAAREPAIAREGLPQIVFDEGVTLQFNDEEIRVIALRPGHTDGDSFVYFTKANVLHMGDQFFNGRFPFIDLGSGGDVAGYVANVEKALSLVKPDTRIIPGHGALATVDDLKKFHSMLLETTGLVKKAIADGKSLDEVKAAGLPEQWKEWGSGFINASRWLEIAYNSLKPAR